MTQKHIERRISIISELSQISASLQSSLQIGPLIAIKAAMEKNISILEDFKNEILKNQARFKELQAEWETLCLLEEAGVEVQ